MKLFIYFLLLATAFANEKIILGEGDYAYEFLPNAITLPEGHAKHVQDYHGIAVDQSGNVYVGYYSKKVNPETRSVARFSYLPKQETPFKFDRFLGDSSWVPNRIHGVNIIRNSKNEERLLLVYNKQQVILSDLDGRVDKEDTFNIKHKVFIKATDGNKSPKSKNIGVYDGYASNKLYELSIDDGKAEKHFHGNKGKKSNQTNTAHGIAVDPSGNYVVADRGNQRLVWRAPDFSPIMSKKNPFKQLELSTPGLEVCNVQFSKDIAVVPCLNAKIAFLKKSTKEECGYEIASVLTMPKELVEQGYDGIHDINFSKDMQYLIIAVWQRHRKTPPRLFALRKIVKNVK